MAGALTVDVHAHYFPAGFGEVAARTDDPRWPCLVPGATEGRILRSGEVFRVVQPACWDLAPRLEAMDAAGVHRQVLSPVPVTLAYWADAGAAALACRLQNDLLAEAVRSHPSRFSALGAVPLQDPAAAVSELERVVAELQLPGVEVGTEVAGRELDDPSLAPFFEAAESLGVAVFVHPTDGGGAIRRSGQPYEFGLGMLTDTAMAAAALVFGGVLERFGRLRIGLAHGCGTFAFAAPRLANAATRVAGAPTPVAVAELTRRLWVDSLVFDPLHLPLLFERFGDDHVFLGSDYPFYPPSWGAPTDVLDAGARRGCCTPAQADAVRGPNGLAFLGLAPTGREGPAGPTGRESPAGPTVGARGGPGHG